MDGGYVVFASMLMVTLFVVVFLAGGASRLCGRELSFIEKERCFTYISFVKRYGVENMSDEVSSCTLI